MAEIFVNLATKDVLRDVTFDGYRLVTWDAWTPKHTGRSHHPIGYVLYAPDGEPIFSGEDFGCPTSVHAIDSDACLRGVLGFLTLRPGDTDPDYFMGYTPRQWAFATNEAEALAIWANDDDDDAPDFQENEP